MLIIDTWIDFNSFDIQIYKFLSIFQDWIFGVTMTTLLYTNRNLLVDVFINCIKEYVITQNRL